MVIRAPGQNPVVRPGANPAGTAQAPAQPTAADALVRLGLFQGGMDPGAAMAKLLSFFVMQGFAPKLDGAKAGGQPLDDAAKLADLLKQLQGKEGLPQTGKLDEKTLKALEKYKPATSPGERATERQAATPERQQSARMATSFRDQSLAAWIKNKASELQKPAQQAPQAPSSSSTTQQSSQAAQPPRPDVASHAQPVNQAPQAAQAQETKNTPAPIMEQSAPGDPKASRESGATKAEQGHGQGQQGSGEEAGRAGKAGKGTGKAEDTPGGRAGDDDGLARGEADQLTAFEDGRGNQATGDEDEEDERRGAALTDDGSGADEGAYEIPSVAEQLRQALAALQMEEQTAGNANRATTYRGDFVFYKPGVYQSRTQAPMILNLKVVKATAYDQVWTQVLQQINARLRVFEPDAPALLAEHIGTALQLARARAT
ncbi:MAG: hypothetical protein HY904_04015 [Deltaproteobacteria bacterium]|nr:hypothetical protein [Deltaproteobacteria bacterium]